ncbi:tyrosine-type recombinase/integrase [Limobrevibacterium gyesilva]|uniref:Tyr recombinase domain-containing protein n=1 Tax=Limobrevibacterium gyesilva TaxID=2991712 RepID=A0AA42CIY5_9PROT|nr:hypothetical protein [Limobrevibacterium gyesilva]MCW3476375.1 hypothetical protein [Limobrevibacterium gyesilva]
MLYKGETIPRQRHVVTWTFVALAEAYKADRDVGLSEDEAKRVNRLLHWIPKGKSADEVDGSFLTEVVSKKRWPNGTSSASRHREVVGVAKAIRSFGASKGWCKHPSDYPKSPPYKGEIEWLDPDEFLRLQAAVPPDLASFMLFLVSTGPRAGEGVEVDRANFRYGWITIVQTKIGGEKRLVQLFPRAREVVLRQIAGGPREGRLFPTVDGTRLPDGTEQSKKVVNCYLRQAAERCRIRKAVTLKLFRSTWTSWHLCVFHDIILTQNVGVWKSMPVVLRHYAGLMPPEMAPDIAKIWGLDLSDLTRWRTPGKFAPVPLGGQRPAHGGGHRSS